MQLQDFYHKDGTGHTKGPPAENDRRSARGPEALDYPEPTRVGEHFQLLPPFLGSLGREQLEPLRTVETCQLIISGQKYARSCSIKTSPDSRTSFTSHCASKKNLKKVFRFGDTSGSSIRIAGFVLAALASTVHCSRSTTSSWV